MSAAGYIAPLCDTCSTVQPGVPMACARCKMVYYCSVACQAKGWPSHKLICVPAPKQEGPPIIPRMSVVSTAPQIPTIRMFSDVEIFYRVSNEVVKAWIERIAKVGFFYIEVIPGEIYDSERFARCWVDYNSPEYVIHTMRLTLRPVCEKIKEWMAKPSDIFILQIIFVDAQTREIRYSSHRLNIAPLLSC